MLQQPMSFRSIRPWDGSQHRAFEELCYQLLGRDGLPEDAIGPTRTGNPDGGVEWYADLVEGTQWGWQAKFIWETSDLLGAMTTTVDRVLRERPNLRRLTFCIPRNLPAGTRGGKATSARRRYDDTVERWKTDRAGADEIEFVLLQESDLLERLARPEHAGRRLFWFSESFIGLRELERFYEKQSDVAGHRYRPELQVDLPIQEDLRALGFGDRFFEELAELRRSFLEGQRYVRLIGQPAAGAEVQDAFDAARRVCDALRLELAAAKPEAAALDPLAALEAATSDALDVLNSAREAVFERQRELERSDASDEDKKLAESLRSDAYYLWRALDAVEDIASLISSPRGRAVRQRAYFLTGSAGTGKTHLLLDATRKALDEGRPAVVLFGAAFGRDGLWQTLSDELGVGSLGSDDLLGAMSACAEAASLQGRRFVIAIDALNETADAAFWASQLPALQATVAQWPLVSLVVSCRDTYVQAVDPDDRRTKNFVVRDHPGFAGREVEATHKYFQHYGLAEPRIPLLLPEFTVPLFLQFYCESLRDAGLDAPPEQHESRLAIFDRFLATKATHIAQALAPQASPFERDMLHGDVRSVLDAFSDLCIGTGREGLALPEVEELMKRLALPSGERTARVIGALERESVLTRDRLYVDGERVECLRFTFQAFADYMILQRRLGETSSDALSRDEELRSWLLDASYGIVEAAAVVLPERFGIELSEYLEPLLRSRGADADEDPQVIENQLHYWLDGDVVETLPLRSAGSITERTIAILNRHLKYHGDGREFFDVLFTIAPQPGHRLNGEGLHDYLSRFGLPNRDAWFGQSVYRVLDDDSSAASRLARWAAAGPYPAYEPEVVELACIPLVWLLSSPNRFMRDWTTKALVQLLRGHPDVLHRLLERFIAVNDPYVVERLLVVAYGALLRRTEPRHVKDWQPIVEFVLSQVFDGLDTLTPGALMLDAARGIVECGAVLGLASQRDLEKARPRYGLKKPGNPWTMETINNRYDDLKTEINKSYLGIYVSHFSMGDFGRYVVGSRLGYFSRIPFSKPYPEKEPEAPPRPISKKKWAAFIRTLSKEQAGLMEALLQSGEDAGAASSADAFHASLSDEQGRLLAKLQPTPRRRRWRDVSYPSERANRWVFQRVLKLGWTPARFGSFDAYSVSSRGRDAHKSERFGKKYQWIGFHELLARVADNFHLERTYDELCEYDGLYQIHARDIDPTLPPISFESFIGERKTSESGLRTPAIEPPPSRRPDYRRYRAREDRFYDDQATLPLAESVLRYSDHSGRSWIILDGRLASRDLDAPDRHGHWDEYYGLEQWAHVASWLIPKESLEQVCDAVLSELEDGMRSDLLDRHGHTDCCYLGELGWRENRCPHRHADSYDLSLGDGTVVPIYFTTEDYTAEGSGFDCSIRDTIAVTCPSAFLQMSGNLRWSRDEASWLYGEEIVVAHVGERDWYSDDFFVAREDWLRSYLADHGFALVVGAKGERRHNRGRETYSQRSLDHYSVAALTADGALAAVRQRVIDNPGHGDDQ